MDIEELKKRIGSKNTARKKHPHSGWYSKPKRIGTGRPNSQNNRINNKIRVIPT